MYRLLAALCLLAAGPAFPRQDPVVCGSNPEKWKEERHLHAQAVRHKPAGSRASQPTAARDIGDIAILEDSDGVVARRNEFNLDLKTLSFAPTTAGASRYRFEAGAGSYDASLASSGTVLSNLGDDDTRLLSLPFAFPFFGNSYRQIFVNSDGNLSFNEGDGASAERSVGRLAAGPPRIAGLFRDLDPTQARQGVRVLSEPGRFAVSWVAVPEYQDFGFGKQQTFQIRLFPDGRIEVAYNGINTDAAVVGISPGGLQGASAVVSFSAGSSAEFSSTVAERFGGTNEIDVTTASQKFYETHEDAYDYLAIFNNLDLAAGSGAIAFEVPVRTTGTGFSEDLIDTGREFGSRSRLQAVLNLGQLSQFPRDPNAPVPSRSSDTPLTVIAHEAGHLFLAYASVRDPNDPRARPMLGRQLAHWSFEFNSEASVLEGNRITDRGAGISPRFVTAAVVQGYAPLDQYLMGFRAPEEVPPTFLVTAPNPSFPSSKGPQAGVEFDGERRDIRIEDIVAAEGRRTPDYTVAQRHFRFGFILVARQGATPTAAELDQLETYRRQFEAYFQHAASDRAFADASLRRGVNLSFSPAGGVLEGKQAPAIVSIQRPAASALTLSLKTQKGAVGIPASVTIPAGATNASFTITGLKSGVEEISAEPADTSFEIAYARVQVAADAQALHLTVVSGDRQTASPGAALPSPVVLEARDINNLPYAGVRVNLDIQGGGSTEPPAPVTDASGRVIFRWTTANAGPASVKATLEGAPANSAVTIQTLQAPSFTRSGVVNAASFASSLSPGSLATILGSSLAAGAREQASFPWPDALANVQVLLNGRSAPLLFVSDNQINFLIPADLGEGSATISLASAPSTTIPISLATVSPGVFVDPATQSGAVLNAGSSETTLRRAAARGAFLEIYCTGLGPVRSRETQFTPQVTIGGVTAPVTFSGLAPGYLGLYQINVQVPVGAPSGTQPLVVTVNGVQANLVSVSIQ